MKFWETLPDYCVQYFEKEIMLDLVDYRVPLFTLVHMHL
jgi:hypothetical protein